MTAAHDNTSFEGLRAALRGTDPLIATFSIIPSPTVCDLICVAGFNAVIIDMEHGSHTRTTVEAAITVADGRGVHSIVRVPDTSPATIQAVLDSGAAGVLVPQVRTPEEAAATVAAARFAPEGMRGVNPWVRAARYGDDATWLSTANRSAAVMVMVEGAEAVARIDEILAVPGLDAVFLGPVDLASSMGLPGQPGHPRVFETMARIASRAADAGVAVAAFAPDTAGARKLTELGVRLVACGEDTAIFRTALADVATAVRSAD